MSALSIASAATLATLAPSCGGSGDDSTPSDADASSIAGSSGGGGEAGAASSGEAGAPDDHGDLQPPPAICGNKKLEGIEQCDDGNLENGDGCSALCTKEACDDCRYGNCGGDEATSGCAHLQAPERNACLAVLYCVLASHCAKASTSGGLECYCGGDAGDCLGDAGGAPSGPCVQPIQSAAGNDASGAHIALQLTDSTTALGSAFMLIGCELSFCKSQCF